jgi:type IV secretory pathway VirB10-like protein
MRFLSRLEKRKDDNMNTKKILPWILGGMLTVSAVGLGFSATTGHAAEKNSQQTKQNQMQQGMMQDGKSMMGQMDPKMMQEMMKNPEMMQQCMEMMQKPEMQAMMKEMMQKPEMQTMMKDMMQKDGQFHKMMSDLVNSVEMAENHEHGAPQATQPAAPGSEHALHH